MAGDIASGLGDLGGAVADLFGAAGTRSAASSYGEAARIARTNAQLAIASTEVKNIQIKRQIARSLGATSAGVAGAGFAASGSALDILRSSAQEGALVKAVNEEQGTITVNAYLEQANQFDAMQKSAKVSSTGQGIAGLLNLGGAAYNFSGAFGGSTAAGGVAAEGGAALPAGAADLVGLAAIA